MTLESPFTKRRQVQWRGPTDSKDANDRIEENFQDLAVLKNIQRLTSDEVREAYSQMLKHFIALAQAYTDLEYRVDSLEAADNRITFGNGDQYDNDRFVGTSFEVPSSIYNTHDPVYGQITLPRVEGSSLSKLYFVNPNGDTTLPSTLEMRVVGLSTSADQPGAVIDTTDPKKAIVHETGTVWERNVIVGALDTDGAIMDVYIAVPLDLSTTANSNAIVVHPFPLMGADIVNVSYTTNTSPILEDADGYITLNSDALYAGTDAAVGHVPPGGWSGDVDNNAGMRAYYFDPRAITALRIRLRQRNYFREGGSYVYSYGLTRLDLRYDKFLDTGRAIIRFDAPSSDTISSVTSVTPQIYNVPIAATGDVFSYRTIWETSFNSGVYTTTPVPFSKRVWVEVTLNKAAGGATPALSGLIVAYA